MTHFLNLTLFSVIQSGFGAFGRYWESNDRNSFSSVLIRAHSRFVPSQWETSLQSYAVSHWLGTNLESALLIIPPEQRSCWGVYWFHSVRLSVRPSVRPSRLPCPLCNIYSSGWILSILTTNDHYHERVCRTQWPLTLTYIFKVIWPWLRKSCPLCSVYSSGWILFIFCTNDHYH